MHEPPQHRPALAQRSPAARRPWASRAEDSAPLAVWHRLATSPPTLQRKASDEEPPKMTVSGDSERKSPTGGVAVRDGTLDWELKYSGKDTEAHAGEGMSIGITLGEDVTFLAHFSPSPGASTCPTITFTQTVKPTIGGLWDTGPLLYTRSAASGASADVLHEPSRPETEPFYGADPSASGPGLKPHVREPSPARARVHRPKPAWTTRRIGATCPRARPPCGSSRAPPSAWRAPRPSARSLGATARPGTA
jgi:hypothetical protein